jgi:hypothetical protein
MKTEQLSGVALDWAAAKCAGIKLEGWMSVPSYYDEDVGDVVVWAPSNPKKAAQAYAIIERVKIESQFNGASWLCRISNPPSMWMSGPTNIVAAMRCFVASEMGSDVDLPKELQIQCQA